MIIIISKYNFNRFAPTREMENFYGLKTLTQCLYLTYVFCGESEIATLISIVCSTFYVSNSCNLENPFTIDKLFFSVTFASFFNVYVNMCGLNSWNYALLVCLSNDFKQLVRSCWEIIKSLTSISRYYLVLLLTSR